MENHIPVGLAGLEHAVDIANQSDSYLGDLFVVDATIRSFAKDALDRRLEFLAGKKSPDDARDDDRDACLALAKVFLGRDKNYTSVPLWNTPGQIDRFLATQLNISENDPTKTVATALALFLKDVYTIQDYAAQPEALEHQWNWQVDALIETYRNILLGIPSPTDNEVAP